MDVVKAGGCVLNQLFQGLQRLPCLGAVLITLLLLGPLEVVHGRVDEPGHEGEDGGQADGEGRTAPTGPPELSVRLARPAPPPRKEV